jgi:glycosyltransferase involved in cell wall biosynthesis
MLSGECGNYRKEKEVKKVRSFHVLQVLRPMKGGMRRHVLDLIDGLQATGHQVTVACPRDSQIVDDLLPWVPVKQLDISDEMNPLSDLKAVRQLQKLLQEEKFDLIHLHGAKAGLIGRLAARLTEPRPAVVYTVHNHVLPRGGMKKHVLNVLERSLAVEADRVITVSRDLYESVRTTHRIPSDSLVTIYNGVDLLEPLTREHARAVLGCDNDKRLVIGAIGRMVQEKGFGTLLGAFEILLARGIEAELVLIGDGPLHSTYQSYVGKIGPSHVRFLGEVPKACRLLQGLDVIVQPSLAEGLGIVPIEAMLAGRPVIASEVGGLPEVVVHGETGLLVKPGDRVALADALQLLIERPEWRTRLGEAGKKRAESLFSRQAMINATLQEYKTVLEKRQGVLL